jgi:hypothetical protein
MDELLIRNREGIQAVLTPAFAPRRQVEASLNTKSRAWGPAEVERRVAPLSKR